MSDPHAKDERIAQLRSAIGAIESTTTDMARRPPQNTTNQSAPTKKPQPIRYVGMPEGEDWMQRLPIWYSDGEGGFDRRIMEELAAVGVPCYTLNDLTKARSVPQGIPIFIDWLTHLEERIPGPETDHRQAIRGNLIRNLNDPAARGNDQAIKLLIQQLDRQPPLPAGLLDYASQALARIATKKDFPRIAGLLAELSPNGPIGPLIEYMGKVKTPEARDISLRYLDTDWTYFSIRALTAMKAT